MISYFELEEFAASIKKKDAGVFIKSKKVGGMSEWSVHDKSGVMGGVFAYF